MGACRFFSLFILTNVVWLSQQKEITIKRNEMSSDIPLSCENEGNDRGINIRNVSFQQRSRIENSLIEEYGAKCNNGSECSVQGSFSKDLKVQVSYKCSGNNILNTEKLTAGKDVLLKCTEGSIGIYYVSSSVQPRSLQTMLRRNCTERNKCNIIDMIIGTFRSNISQNVEAITVKYACKEVESCRLSITEDFAGQTLTSASDIVIESANQRLPQDIKCRITSSNNTYLSVSIVKFRTKRPFSLQFNSTQGYVNFTANSESSPNNSTIHLSQNGLTWHEQILMKFQGSAQRKVGFQIRMEAFDINSQKSTVNITCHQTGFHNVTNISACPKDTTTGSQTTTTKTFLSSNISNELYTTIEDDDLTTTHMPTTPDIPSTSSTILSPTTSKIPTTPDIPSTSSTNLSPTTSNIPTTYDILTTSSTNITPTSSKMPTTPDIPSTLSFNFTQTASSKDRPEKKTSGLETNTIISNYPATLIFINDTTLVHNYRPHEHHMITFETSTNSPNKTLVPRNSEILKKLTDITWKLAIVGVFLLMLTGVLIRLVLKRKKKFKMKQRPSVAISDVVAGAISYEMWESVQPDDTFQTQETLTTTFQESPSAEDLIYEKPWKNSQNGGKQTSVINIYQNVLTAQSNEAYYSNEVGH